MLASDCSKAGISVGDFLLSVIVYIRIETAAWHLIKIIIADHRVQHNPLFMSTEL